MPRPPPTTTLKPRLPFAAEVLDVGVPEQELHHRLGVGGDVERLGVAHAGERAGGDIADRVTACLLRRHSDCCETPHQVWGVLDVHVVQLEVLSRRDVQDLVRILFGTVGDHLELLGSEAAERQLAGGVAVGAFAVVVTLTVCAAAQASLCKDLLVQLALQAKPDLCFESVDLLSPFGLHLAVEEAAPGCHQNGLSLVLTMSEGVGAMGLRAGPECQPYRLGAIGSRLHGRSCSRPAGFCCLMT